MDINDSDATQSGNNAVIAFTSPAAGALNLSYGIGVDCDAVACALTASGETLEACRRQRHSGSGADDYITFSLNPTGTGLGASYSLTVNGGGTVALAGGGAATGIAYGAATAFPPPKRQRERDALHHHHHRRERRALYGDDDEVQQSACSIRRPCLQ